MDHQHQVPRLSYTLDQAIAATGLGRTRIYTAIANGTLRTFKDGRRRMVSAQALTDYIQARERETAAA